ncbi:MAG: response regulator [Coxiellaceae bacterium]|nr:response regulator [Coxiellaceae bacterium]
MKKNNKSKFDISDVLFQLPGHVYWKDENCILQGCNHQQALDCDLNSWHQIVGKTAFDIIDGKIPKDTRKELADETNRIDRSIMDSDKTTAVEEVIANGDGSKAIVISVKAPLHDASGKVNGLVGVSIDITNLKDKEHRLVQENKKIITRASKEKSEIIAALNNDVRSQMHTVLMYTSLLSRSSLTDKQRTHVMAIEEAINNISPILEYADDVANIDSDSRPFLASDIHPYHYIERNLKLCYPLVMDKNINAYIDLRCYQGYGLVTSCVYFDRVVKALINSAIEVSLAGDMVLALNDATFDGTLTFSIKVGHSVVDVATLRNKLTADSDANDHISMKLVFARKVADKMGGDLWLDKTVNGGISINLTIPLSEEVSKHDVKPLQNFKSVTYFDNNGERSAIINAMMTHDDHVAIDYPFDETYCNRINVFDESYYRLYADQIKNCVTAHRNKKLFIVIQDSATAIVPPENIRVISKPVTLSSVAQIDRLAARYQYKQAKILVVDDVEICQRAMKIALTELGYDCDIASSGEAAIEKANEHTYTAIFLDVGLPGVDGLQTAVHLKETLANKCPTLFAVTGLTRTVEVDDLFAEGVFADVILKPATVEVLESSLNDVLNDAA